MYRKHGRQLKATSKNIKIQMIKTKKSSRIRIEEEKKLEE
jgi:hypothetical protein